MQKNLKDTGNNEDWLRLRLKEQNKKLSEVFIATCDGDNNLKIVECFEKNYDSCSGKKIIYHLTSKKKFGKIKGVFGM
jgi:hypothetical protein